MGVGGGWGVGDMVHKYDMNIDSQVSVVLPSPMGLFIIITLPFIHVGKTDSTKCSALRVDSKATNNIHYIIILIESDIMNTILRLYNGCSRKAEK